MGGSQEPEKLGDLVAWPWVMFAAEGRPLCLSLFSSLDINRYFPLTLRTVRLHLLFSWPLLSSAHSARSPAVNLELP